MFLTREQPVMEARPMLHGTNDDSGPVEYNSFGSY
jgi:hypothetical protein